MGCIHRQEIIKLIRSDNSQPSSGEDIINKSLKEENINKINSFKNSNNNYKSNNIFYEHNSNNSGSNVTSNNKINNQNKNNTISSLISNDYFNNKYNIIGEINNQQNIVEYKIQLKSNNTIIRCMRKIKKSSNKQDKEDEDNSIYEEVNILKKMNHKHICQLYECIITPDSFFLIMEYCKEGNLENKLKWSIKYSENQIKYLAYQLFGAVQYLNKNNYMHTDIKPINILIDEIVKNDNDEELFNIKLLSFGSYIENMDNNNMNRLPYYSAPEVLKNIYDATSDVWSIGVIIYQMFYGEVPFGGDNINELYSNIKNGQIIHTSSTSNNLRDLLDLIFVKNYKKRINVNKCLEHNWFYVGNKTPKSTDVFKNCIIEEINTDIKDVKNIEKNSNSSESNSSKEKENEQSRKKLINRERISKKSMKNKNLVILSIQKSKRISKVLLFGMEKKEKKKITKINNKIPPLIKYIILYIKYYIRIYFQREKEINKLNNIYLKYKIENNINLFMNYINNTRKISFDNFYYNSNSNLLNKHLINKIKENINNRDELFEILIQNKNNYIENNLKNSFSKLKKSNIQEIKNIFKECNNINLYEIQKYKIYFNEMEFEMGKNKYKEIYLFMDFFKILKNAINKLYSQIISNNISTNVDSFTNNNTNNNTVQGLNNKSKDSIKNDNSKENSDKIILEQINDKEEDEKSIISETIKKPEKNNDKNNDNKDKYDLSLNNDVNNRDNNINSKNNLEKNKKNYNDKNIINVNIIKNDKENKNKNEENILKVNKKNTNTIIDINKNVDKINGLEKKDDEYNDDYEYETEERKNDKNRFDPEKFLALIGFS